MTLEVGPCLALLLSQVGTALSMLAVAGATTWCIGTICTTAIKGHYATVRARIRAAAAMDHDDALELLNAAGESPEESDGPQA